jgi:ABC-type transport system involved in multi-copper enzyme maturation permease subunit
MSMNPVLRKDILGLLRLRRVAAIQIFFVAVLALMVLATWPQGGVVEGTVAVGADTPLVRADDQLLLGLVLGQIVLLILFVPGIASVALTGEKEANTLEMLYASRLKPLEIINGKVGLAVAFPLLLLISGLPFVAMLSYRGDVRPDELLWSYVILGVTAVFLAMLSLAISAASKQSSTALVIAYVAVLVLCGGVLVPAAIMLDTQTGTGAQVLHYVRGVSPVAAALSLLRPQMDFGGSGWGMLPLWQVFLPIAAVGVLGSGAFLVARLRRPPTTPEALGTGTAQHEQNLAHRLLYLIDPNQQPKPITGWNPLIPKERRTSQLRSGRWMIRIFYGALFLSLGLAAMALYGGPEHSDLLAYVAAVLVAFQIGLIGLVVPSLTSSTVSSEFENGTFETLRLTPLSGGQIFWGKFIPAFLPALLPIIALLPGYAAIAYIDQGYITRVAMLLPILVLAVAFCCTLGLLCSSFVSNTARATVASYLVTAALFILPLFGWWAGGQQITVAVGAWIGFVSPLVMGLNLLPEGSPRIQALYTPHLWVMLGLCIAMLLVARARLTVLLRQG